MVQQKSKNQATEKRLSYPHIETLLESENFNKINTSFATSYEKLSQILENKSGSLKTQKEARAAMKAYELTTDLLKELLKLKYVIQSKGDKNQKK